jgi:Tol biopolymer transport system component
LPVAWWAGQRGVSTAGEIAAFEAASMTPFTTNLGYNGEATIAPDNQTIAYVSDRTGRFDIFLRQIGTSADIALTHDQGDNIQPAFSPDGRQIAFVSSRAGGTEIFYPGFDNPMAGGDIWVMPALGATPRRIAKDGNFPSWSPDGTNIVFVRPRIGLFEVAASGGDVREIKVPSARGYFYPAYSSDSRWVFFEDTANGINAVPVTGGAFRQIATGRHPVWDASSQAVIYSDSREGNNHSLWSVPFSTNDGKPSGTPRPLTVGRGRDWQPAVSKDGKLVAFTAIQASFNLEVVPFDAEAGRVLGSPRAVTTGNQVSYFMRFSPDGRSVAFESSRGAGRHIWRVDIGADPVQLTSDPKFEETFPQWSPDGSTIAFARQPAQSPNARSLWLMDTDGANPRQILEGNVLTRWLADGSGLVYQNQKNLIFFYDLANGRSRPIATQPDVVSMHTPSLDAKWIVYQSTSTDAGNVDVHAVGLDGGQPRVVASTRRQDFHPFFSPSGRWVYFQPDHKNLNRVPGPGQDWKRADPVKVTDFPESGLFLEDPQISRDGKQLLYARGKITGDIWILKRGK